MTKKPSRTALKKELQQIINRLVEMGVCTWYYCPGPNRPDKPGWTCTMCQEIKALRKLRDKL